MAKWGSCDFEQLIKLQKNIEELQKLDMDKFCRSCSKELAARLLSLVIPKTHVGKYDKAMGKKGGTLRRGWTAKGEKDAAAGGSMPKPKDYVATLPIKKVGNTYQITVYNPVHYASYVEFGHRQTPGRYVPAIGKRLTRGWVEGQYMLTISEETLKAKIPGILERKMHALLKETFNV